MRLVITDTGKLWRYDDPVFEQFKDILLIVSISGIQV